MASSVSDAKSVRVIVLGAGVIGLTSAMLLSRDKRFDITIAAKHMPGDYDIDYASPWAGANFLPIGAAGSLLAKLEADTWPELARLVTEAPDAAIHFQDTVIYKRKMDGNADGVGKWMENLVKDNSWYKDVVPNYRQLEKDELPDGHNSGFGFTSVCINTAIYLPWLLSQCLKNGVKVRRAKLQDIGQAADLHSSGRSADIVVNATGLGSAKLGGVKDPDVYPARGQIVLVRNEAKLMISTSGTDDGPEEATYIMQRAAGGGCILGGCLQPDNWESQPDPSLALRIMKRSVDVHPALTNGKGVEALDVIRHAVGLRPMRKGGPRIERQQTQSGLCIVHAYGHGGYGFQSSYGTANMVVDLVDSIARGS